MNLKSVLVADTMYAEPTSAPGGAKVPKKKRMSGPRLYLNGRHAKLLDDLDGARAGDFVRIVAVAKIKRLTTTDSDADKSAKDNPGGIERDIELEFHKMGLSSEVDDDVREASFADDEDEDDKSEED